MAKVKRISVLTVVLFFSAFIFISYNTVYAAKKLTVPQVIFNTAPILEYKVGDRVNFNISTPNYGGRVEYRVVLWEDSKKTAHDLWNSSNGYPNRYYTKWQPYGNNTFTLGWPVNEPGNYRITVYVKRVGIPNSRAALKGMNCDSFKESVAFVVKPAEDTSNSNENGSGNQADGKSTSTTPLPEEDSNTIPGTGGGNVTPGNGNNNTNPLIVEAAGVVLSNGTVLTGAPNGANEYYVDLSGYDRLIGVRTSITVNRDSQLTIMRTNFAFQAHNPKILGPSDFGMIDNDPPGISIGNLRDNYSDSQGYYTDSISLYDASNNSTTITIKMKVK